MMFHWDDVKGKSNEFENPLKERGQIKLQGACAKEISGGSFSGAIFIRTGWHFYIKRT